MMMLFGMVSVKVLCLQLFSLSIQLKLTVALKSKNVIYNSCGSQNDDYAKIFDSNAVLDRAGPTLAADSGTQFTMLTLATAMSWNGKARVQLNFIGANGAPFAVFGDDDCIVEILNDGGI